MERKTPGSWRGNELQVVIEERGFEADAFFQLQKRGLVGEAGALASV